VMISLPSTTTRTMTDRRWRSLIAFCTIWSTAASWVGLTDGPLPFVVGRPLVPVDVAGAVLLFMLHTVAHGLRVPRSRSGPATARPNRTTGITVAGRCQSVSHAGLVRYLYAP
jgi:hypothetical protein